MNKSKFNKSDSNNVFEELSSYKSSFRYELDSDKYKNSIILFDELPINKQESESDNKIKEEIKIDPINPKIRNAAEPKLYVYFYMQIEYCQGFPLSFYLENRSEETEKNLIYFMFKQILVGLNHIHHHNIIHRDLK